MGTNQDERGFLHELMNPLCAAKGLIQLLSDGQITAEKENKEITTRCLAAITRATNLVTSRQNVLRELDAAEESAAAPHDPSSPAR